MKCARPYCEEAEDRIDGYCSVYCRDVHDVQKERDKARLEINALRDDLAAYQAHDTYPGTRVEVIKSERDEARSRKNDAELAKDAALAVSRQSLKRLEKVREVRDSYAAWVTGPEATTNAQALIDRLDRALNETASEGETPQ